MRTSTWFYAVAKVDRRIRWHYTTTILRLRIGARLTRYRNCKFHNFARTISRHADGISRYSVPPSAGPLLPLVLRLFRHSALISTSSTGPWWNNDFTYQFVFARLQFSFNLWCQLRLRIITSVKYSFEFLYSFGPTHARNIETEMILAASNNI